MPEVLNPKTGKGRWRLSSDLYDMHNHYVIVKYSGRRLIGSFWDLGKLIPLTE